MMDCLARLVLGSALVGVPAVAGGLGGTLPPLDGFTALVQGDGVPPVSIVLSKGESEAGMDPDNTARLDWGRQMLAELDQALTVPSGEAFAKTGDLLALREWCLRAPGAGNLALAISAEEVAVELLFRALADENGRPDGIRSPFRQVLPGDPTPGDWLASLEKEGVDVHAGTELDEDAADYLQLKAIFSFVTQQFAGPDAKAFFPKTNWPRQGCLDEFNPYALMWRTMLLEDKKVSLRVCLTIHEALGTIPEDSGAFRDAATRHADDLLLERERLTSWTTSADVWNHWADVLDVVRPGPESRRLRR